MPTPVHVLAGALADARLVRTAMDREDEYTVVFVSSSDEAGDTVRVRYNISGEQEDLFLPRLAPAPPAVASASPIGVPIISRSWSASALDELGGMDSDEGRATAASASPIGAPIISSADFAALDELGGMDSDEEDGADAGEDDGVDDDLPSLVRRLSSQPAPDGMGALPTTTATARRMSCVVGESFNVAAVTYIITTCGGHPISVFEATGFDVGNPGHRRLGGMKGCAREYAHPVVSVLRDVLVTHRQCKDDKYRSYKTALNGFRTMSNGTSDVVKSLAVVFVASDGVVYGNPDLARELLSWTPAMLEPLYELGLDRSAELNVHEPAVTGAVRDVSSYATAIRRYVPGALLDLGNLNI